MKKSVLLLVFVLLVVSGCEEVRESPRKTQLSGNVEILEIDNFETGENSRIYYLNDGKKDVELILEDNVALPGGKVRLSGEYIGNKFIVDDFIVEELREESTEVLGEQKYIGVYLYPTEEPNPLFEEYSGEASEILNDFVLNKSYGLAGFSLRTDQNFIFYYECEDELSYLNLMNYAVEAVDPYVDFNLYDGLIVFYPNIREICNYDDIPAGQGAYGKNIILTDDGEVNLYKMWIYTDIEGGPKSLYALMRHEITHNFGMPHQRVLICGDYANRRPLDASCIGVSDKYTPFVTNEGDFSVRDKYVLLGWIDENNVIEATNGEFFVVPMSLDVHGTEYVQGIKIPIEGDLEGILMDGVPIQSESNSLTHYYLEYWNENLPLSYLYDVDDGAFQSEDFYGLNATNITEAVFLRLGRDSIYAEGGYISNTRTYMTSNHPNACVYIEGQEPCEDQIFAPAVFAYILEGESYYDEYNKIRIDVLELTEEGALIKVISLFECYSDCSLEGCEGMPCGENEVCEAGACVLDCPEGWIDCSGECVDWMTDENHCGGCNIRCEAGKQCINGQCRKIYGGGGPKMEWQNPPGGPQDSPEELTFWQRILNFFS